MEVEENLHYNRRTFKIQIYAHGYAIRLDLLGQVTT